jgi:hypothetical protein
MTTGSRIWSSPAICAVHRLQHCGRFHLGVGSPAVAGIRCNPRKQRSEDYVPTPADTVQTQNGDFGYLLSVEQLRGNT